MKKANKNYQSNQDTSLTAVMHVDEAFKSDLKNSFLIVSVAVNVVILVAYLVVQTTTAFDHQLVTLLLAR